MILMPPWLQHFQQQPEQNLIVFLEIDVFGNVDVPFLEFTHFVL